jgi:hypothetical protein
MIEFASKNSWRVGGAAQKTIGRHLKNDRDTIAVA